jgi:hypothetical protein
VAELDEPPTPPAHRHPPSRKPLLHRCELGLKVLQAALLLEPLRLRRIATHAAMATADRHGQPRSDRPARTAQTDPNVEQVALSALPLIVGGPGDRPCPTQRRCRGQGALPVSALVVADAEPAPHCQVVAGQPAKVLTDHA